MALSKTTWTIDSDGGGDYSTVTAWQSAEQSGNANLVSDATGVVTLLLQGATAFTDNFSISGWTCDATNYIRVLVDEGENIVFNLAANTNIAFQDDYCTLEGDVNPDSLIINAGANTSNGPIVILNNVGNGLERCILNGGSDSNVNGLENNNDVNQVVRDVVIHSCARNFFGGYRFNANVAVTLEHCTFWNNIYNIRDSGANNTADNCIVFAGTTANWYGTPSGAYSYIGTDDASVPNGGTGHQTSLTVADHLNDAAGGDFSLKAGSALIGAGFGGEDIGARYTSTSVATPKGAFGLPFNGPFRGPV